MLLEHVFWTQAEICCPGEMQWWNPNFALGKGHSELVLVVWEKEWDLGGFVETLV